MTFAFDMPPFFMGTAIDIPSGMSCRQIAIAKLSPNLSDASNPEPIANPSGKLWIARPIDTTIPVFNKLLFESFVACFVLNFFSTNRSQNIMAIIPTPMPNSTFKMPLIPNASGIKSKQIIAIIRPEANDSMKLKNLLEFFFRKIPIIPPIVVPNVPKNSPIRVVFKISNVKTPYHIFNKFYGKEFNFIHIFSFLI